ncbi:type III-A CRISPR-associated RAMP protein Csm3 [Microscilla marina]|uniref:CRISPR system Cms endoribonuclease Csm3 n=1 Tax=Microscilla marina ATCC 23134 TaxID=313606 RepID=A1ZV98_MICM2|nr:type III-A CRISPR-associated RAMP protein Csm3 [Microscilla marina]EAY25754.1 crispr-associated ramp protein, Csm3 family [Microscilla marina ATCC 23134]
MSQEDNPQEEQKITSVPVFKANLVLRGKIECVTGLHIGGSKEKLEIGGVDSPVLRNPQTRYPYIPGSSIKGKLRYLLEYSTGAVTKPVKNKFGDVSVAKDIVRIFGIGADDKEVEVDNDKDSESDKKYKASVQYLKETGPTRLIVRDCNPDDATQEMWKNLDSELLYTEYKPENTIDRLTSAANPRFIERVVAGSYFDFEVILGVFYNELMDEQGNNVTTEDYRTEQVNASKKDVANLMQALRLLENNTLGKSGSRGYGQIKLHLSAPAFVTSNDYIKDSVVYQKAIGKLNKDELKGLSEIVINYPENL